MPSVKNLIVLLTAIILHSLSASGVGMALTPLDPGGNLSNFKVNTVVKSSDGYVWAGTLSGLSRHDSYSSTPYYINGSDMAPVGDNDVDGIWEDSTGRLWLKSHNMWHIYNPLTDLIEHNPDSILSAAGVKGYPTAIGTDRAGGMWVATDAGKIFHLAAGENSTAREVDLGNFPSLKGKKITGACDSREGMVFVTDRGELYCVSHGSAKVRWHDGSIARSIPEGDTMVFSIMLDREGLGWIYNTEQLWLYNSHTRSWANDRLPASGLGMVVKAIVEDDNGRVLIGRDHHGLELADKSARDIVFRQVDSGLPEDATVTSLFNDANGELWVGTYKHGVFMAGSEAREFSIVDTPDVNCMLERPDGKVWIGTDSRGLMLWDPASGNLSSIPDTSEKGEPSAITALYAAPGGQLLVGRFSRGLSELADGRMHKVVTSSPLDGTYAWGFAPAPAGKIWVATLTAGLFLYDPATGEARQWSTANSTLPSNCVVTVTTGTDGSVYAGTDRGLVVLTPDGKEIKTACEMPAGNITALFTDSRGLIWIASRMGVDVYDPLHSKLTNIHYSDGPLNASGLVEDRQGNIWATDGPALYRIGVSYNPANGVIASDTRKFDHRDGLQKGSFNQRALTTMKNGEVLAGGVYGINRFRPTDIKADTRVPKVMFSSLSIDDKLIRAGEKIGGRTVIESALRPGATIELAPSVNRFTLALGTDDYVTPQKERFRYKLEGYDTKWATTHSGDNTISYSHLPAGTYRLLVKAVNSDGMESPHAEELLIRVLPPFYLSLWARILYVALGLAAIWGLYRYVGIRERRRFNEKRLIDAARKEEELNQLKFRFLTNIGHDLRTPLTLIISPLDNMLRDTTDDATRRKLSLMRKNAGHLLRMVNQLLDFRKSEVSTLVLKPVDSDMYLFLDNICRSFLSISDPKEIDIKFESNVDSLPMRFDEDKFYKVMMNLLGNAFKFTPEGGKVTVSLDTDAYGRDAVIKVADTGCGIPDGEKNRIFDRFFQGEKARKEQHTTGYGIGLSLVKEYISLQGGTISVENNTPTGTVFRITIPIIPCENTVSPTQVVTEDATAAPGLPDAAGTDSRQPSPANPDIPVALVVDDNSDMLDFLREGLSSDFRVITAADGESALKILSTIRPAIILTDIMMPGMNGMELCRRIKTNRALAGVPVVALSARNEEQAKVEMLTIGADDYLTKPFNTELLALRMKRLVKLTSPATSSRPLINPEPGEIVITSLDEKMVEKATKYVVANMKRTDLSVEELSAHMGMSRVHFYKRLKSVTGKTPVEFIRLLRLKRSAQLLRESQLNVSEVAYQVGFNNPKYFARYFADEFGMLPSVYKDQNGQTTLHTL